MGVTLSGGQKARISLARSVYHKADVYLLDDPLSAVDVGVGKEIFKKCIRGLLRDKLVLMVTHQVNYVKQCDRVIIMKEGGVVCDGTYAVVIEENEFCREFLQDLEKKDENNKPGEVIDSISEATSESEEEPTTQSRTRLPSKEEKDVQPLSSAMTSEDYRPNSTSLLVYLRYFWEGGLMATILTLVLSVLGNGGLLLAYWWMQTLTSCVYVLSTNQSIGMYNSTNQSIGMYNSTNRVVAGNNTTNGTIEMLNRTCPPWYYDYNNIGAIRLLALITFVSALFVLFRGFNFYYIALHASKRLHNKMLRRLVHTPVRFFDTNPSGRVLNRFSKDVGFMDEQLPQAFYDFWHHVSNITAIVVATSIDQVFLLIPFALLFVCMLLLRFYYLRTCSQVRSSVLRVPAMCRITKFSLKS